jgi:hypothetical protein
VCCEYLCEILFSIICVMLLKYTFHHISYAAISRDNILGGKPVAWKMAA